MSAQSVTLKTEDDTAEFARRIGARLLPGDVILLDGPIGAGKTHFARALIKSLLLEDEDVPSPTFTLVQTYETRNGPLWHADLYRITSDMEIEELGLVEAFETAICLVEWPERLGPLRPDTGLTITLAPGPEESERHATLEWGNARWSAVLNEVQDA